MKKGWERYASEKRYIQKGYLRKHSDGGSGRKAREASRSDRLQQSRQEQKEVAIQSYGKVVLLTENVVPNEPFTADEALALSVYEKSLKDIKNEERREEESAEALEGRQEGIQGTDQRRSEIEESSNVSKEEVKVAKVKRKRAKK
jgi:hypothetical protein